MAQKWADGEKKKSLLAPGNHSSCQEDLTNAGLVHFSSHLPLWLDDFSRWCQLIPFTRHHTGGQLLSTLVAVSLGDRSFTSLSSNLLPLSDFSPYRLGNISQTHHLLPVRVTLLNLFLPSGIPNPSLPVKCYASSKTLPQRLSSNTQKPSWFFSNQTWSLSITVCIIYSTNIYWRLPMSQVVCLTLNINIYYNSIILMGMLSFKKKTEFAKVLFRIQMQIDPYYL